MIKAVEISNNGMVLRGILYKPEIEVKVPLVILFHGFSGSKSEIHFMFTKTSRVLAKNGIASLRFDFSGSGDSDGKFSDMTLLSEVSDGLAILDYAKTLDFIDEDNISLVGLSMGGAVASIVASKRKNDIDRLCLWAAVGDAYKIFKYNIEKVADEIKFNEKNQIDLNANVLGKAFFDELESLDIYALTEDFKGKVMIIHGSEDNTVPIDNAYKFKETYGENASLHIIEDSGHTFDSEKWEQDVIEKTLSFLDNK